jgi:ABC-type multidrug transport system fused ATPase/permease subunit
LSTLNWVVVAFLISALVFWGASYAQTYLVGWVGQRVLQDLRIQIFAHLQTLSVGFYERRQAGVIISRMTNDVQALDQLVTDGVVTLFGSTLTLIGTAVILFILDAELALLTFLVFPVLGVASLVFRIVSADAYRLTREKVAAITAYLQETLSGVRIVRAFAQEPRHLERFAELNDDNRDANMKTVNLNAAYFPGVELLSAVATIVILSMAARKSSRARWRSARSWPSSPPSRSSSTRSRRSPALHDLSGGHGRARQDLRAARRGARPARAPGRDRARAAAGRDLVRRRLLLLRRRRRGRPLPHRSPRSAGPDRRPRRLDGRREVDVCQARGALL